MRLEDALSQTKRGQERLEHTQQRFARRSAAAEAPARKGAELAESNTRTGARTDRSSEAARIPETIAEADESSEDSIADLSEKSDTDMGSPSYEGSYEPSSSGSVQHLLALEVKPDDADIGPVLAAVAQDERLSELVLERNCEIL